MGSHDLFQLAVTIFSRRTLLATGPLWTTAGLIRWSMQRRQADFTEGLGTSALACFAFYLKGSQLPGTDIPYTDVLYW